MASEPERSDSIRDGLKRLWLHVSPQRRRQIYLVMGLMLVGAVAQLFSLGALLPFIAVLSDPAKVASYPIVNDLLMALGWTDPKDIIIPVTVLFGVVTTIAGVILLYLTWVSQKVVFKLGHDLSVGSSEGPLPALPLSRLEELQRPDRDRQQGRCCCEWRLLQLMRLVTSVVISLFIVGALFYIDPVIAVLAGAGFGLTYLLVTYMTRFRVRKNSEVWAKTQGQRVQALQEGLGGIRDVILDHSQPTFINRYATFDAACAGPR
jgi:ABC-type multidrug transport system fused ATPase/permease subunit